MAFALPGRLSGRTGYAARLDTTGVATFVIEALDRRQPSRLMAALASLHLLPARVRTATYLERPLSTRFRIANCRSNFAVVVELLSHGTSTAALVDWSCQSAGSASGQGIVTNTETRCKAQPTIHICCALLTTGIRYRPEFHRSEDCLLSG